jgi:riboflavin biosynthesis pyrimidine reductase
VHFVSNALDVDDDSIWLFVYDAPAEEGDHPLAGRYRRHEVRRRLGTRDSRLATRIPDPGSRIPIPTISLVFVQSKDGNTGIDQPEALGGGATDKHLIYEGLSRVAADAVLAGASTAGGENVFFSVWHPELVALRLSLGLPRHPAQVVVTGRACIDPNMPLLFNVPDVPVFVLGSVYACGVLANAAASRPWVRLVRMEGEDLRPALSTLVTGFGIRRISCIGGRTTATALLDASLVDDLCLTTTAREGGDPDTPFYVGQHLPALEPIVRKRGLDPHAPILFEHFRVMQRQP